RVVAPGDGRAREAQRGPDPAGTKESSSWFVRAHRGDLSVWNPRDIREAQGEAKGNQRTWREIASTRRGMSRSATEHSAARSAPVCGITKMPSALRRPAASAAPLVKTVVKKPPS